MSRGAQVSAPRYAQGGDLAILSAESYDPGLSFEPSSRAAVTRKAQPSISNTEDGPRKRAKRQSPDGEEREDDEKKRSRGRPRLDMKDETAADRRRTQIRLAQRAYRNRKENAIQTLEKKVQELKDTNEDMSNAFMKLHDYAVSHGLVDQVPDFGRQLRTTTQKFLALARRSSEDGNNVPGDTPADADDAPAPRASNKTSSNRRDHSKSSSPDEVPEVSPATHSTNSPPAQLYGGFVITHEPVSHLDLMADFTNPFDNHHPATTNPPPTTSTSSIPNPHDPLPSLDLDPGYEIITHPTLDNASFPFDLNLATTSTPDFSSFLSSSSPFPSHHQNPFSMPSPYTTLPLPPTYAPRETTFGRRLQRTGIERALTLISMPNPPPKRFERVFGFCLLLEPREAIMRRLKRAVATTQQESISNWQYPYYNLGGAGTHYDATAAAAHASGQRVVGNQGTVDVLKPRESNGFSTGPFSEMVMGVMRDGKLDGEGRAMSVEGFTGEFYDCDEVEMYLLQRGVAIPGGADYVTAEVDDGMFKVDSGKDEGVVGSSTSCVGGSGEGVGGSTSSSSGGGSGRTTGSSYSAASSASSSSRSPLSSGASPAVTTLADDTSNIAWGIDPSSLVDPMLTGVFSTQPQQQQQQHAAVESPFMDGGNGMMAFAAAMYASAGNSPLSQGGVHAVAPKRKKVTVDVNLLVYELTNRTICLGRTPGIRQKDINAAFWSAAQVIA
ncbi:hypothetical protein B0T19DRAFT_115016 [Cercophora scortea]|uniref:BZIP domain-containing protein n=1 Tax=Cercophora scortea TaxID=314031 RepID=A0AAE0MIL4_9PEZI|nr:hypothetical protein B0T19DRAFT_115016 [Cercophora scortea]